MLEFQQKRKVRKILYSWPVILLLCIVAIFFVRASWNVYTKEAQSRDYLDQAQAELDKASTTDAGLSQSVASLQTPAGVDADIRRKFRVVKPGEQIAVIVDGDASDSLDVATSTVPTLSFWQKIEKFFSF